MQRRRLLKLGIGAAAVLAVAGGGLALLRPGLQNGRLAPAGREVFEAVARAVLDGMLPADASARGAALQGHLQRLDDTVAGFPAATQAELSQLLGLLGSAAGRIALAGLRPAWTDARVDELQQSLQSMRTASLALRQQAYHALRDLTNAAYFADASAWAALGYAGPKDL
jgi:hypothetical protein